ncbi:poly-gamma-glutamate biosynthesis like protein [Ameyamaea chiangmaiensis NBRC 103196]|uniref:CapA family protein n=1 Tax=Ameyamaea chiangmaiensis TaxID=442969 RepID=A0A850PAS7_9PROT|nr:CapA family protein [Ameyamaea chiangmaiensis]MBS4076125.1 CapA family protein [Ameyamaea chiangmaiensis]NVN39640.1 CapA family protein [Ameyamaea chiangmaiensis]GBQ67111.1 poly-gamma-glutamate biosynthesis like protein [Ameyamaea chiangmaiensis NBRC 103196]
MKICLTGDSILFRRLNSLTDPKIAPLFDKIRSCDVSFTNLELVPNDFEGDPALDMGGTHFGASSWVVDELAEAGFDLFAAATNHSLDYSISGLRKTMEVLDQREILYSGIGKNLEEARRPAYATHPRGTVSMLSCVSTFARGQEAADQTQAMQGRPGINPLRYSTLHHVSAEEYERLGALYARLGLQQVRDDKIQLGFAFPTPPGILAFENLSFTIGDRTEVRTAPHPGDVAAIARWIGEARMVSDTVIVSVHAHESGYNESGVIDVETPAEFLVAFARRAIDEGADIVAAHGPHLLRGMEIYRGKPIFYSLGNFIGQNELVERLPVESYAVNRVSTDLTPHRVYKARSNNDAKGFPAETRFWETVMPICTYDKGVLTGIEIHPITLNLGPAAHVRGVPSLAGKEEGPRILENFARLSAPFGTRFEAGGSEGAPTLSCTLSGA